MEILLSELGVGRSIQTDSGPEMALFLRPSHVMDHLSTAPHLRPNFDALPIKTARVFKQQLQQSGVVAVQSDKPIEDVEKRIFNRRHGHMTALSLAKFKSLDFTPRQCRPTTAHPRSAKPPRSHEARLVRAFFLVIPTQTGHRDRSRSVLRALSPLWVDHGQLRADKAECFGALCSHRSAMPPFLCRSWAGAG